MGWVICWLLLLFELFAGWLVCFSLGFSCELGWFARVFLFGVCRWLIVCYFVACFVLFAFAV